MIDSIHGIIEKKEPTNLFIKLNGFVFNVSICIRDYEKLPSVGKKIDILTYLNVRENLMELYGFLSKERRDLFIQLISVSGIGPRTAINLLSNVSGSPPFLEVMVAHPAAADSIAVRPKGSCHFDGTTDIADLL